MTPTELTDLDDKIRDSVRKDAESLVNSLNLPRNYDSEPTKKYIAESIERVVMFYAALLKDRNGK